MEICHIISTDFDWISKNAAYLTEKIGIFINSEMETISSNNIPENYTMSQKEGISSAFSVTGCDDAIQPTYISETVNIISLFAKGVKNYRRNNKPEGTDQNPPVDEGQLKNNQERINSLKKEIEKSRSENKEVVDELTVKEKVIKNICKTVLTLLEYTGMELDKKGK